MAFHSIEHLITMKVVGLGKRMPNPYSQERWVEERSQNQADGDRHWGLWGQLCGQIKMPKTVSRSGVVNVALKLRTESKRRSIMSDGHNNEAILSHRRCLKWYTLESLRKSVQSHQDSSQGQTLFTTGSGQAQQNLRGIQGIHRGKASWWLDHRGRKFTQACTARERIQVTVPERSHYNYTESECCCNQKNSEWGMMSGWSRATSNKVHKVACGTYFKTVITNDVKKSHTCCYWSLDRTAQRQTW